MRKLMYLFPLILTAILSCNQNDLSKPASSGQLKETQTYYVDSIYYRYFHYDSQGKLTLIKDSLNRPNYKTISRVLTYDMNGRLEKVTTFHHFMTSDRIFYYNNSGQIVRVKDSVTSQPSALTAFSMFSYDNNGRLITDSSFDELITRNVTHYTYDQNDNIVSQQFAYWNYASNMLDSYPGSTNISYGTQLNPYSSMGKLLYILFKDWSYLSRNNILVDNYVYNYGQSLNTYSYVFSATGQAQEMTQTVSGFTPPYDHFVTKFFY